MKQGGRSWRTEPHQLSHLQVVLSAKSDRDGFCSYPGVLCAICGDDGHVPASFWIGVHLDIVSFLGEAVPNHFRQFVGCYLRFALHSSVPTQPAR
jgi:hypothetical protein